MSLEMVLFENLCKDSYSHSITTVIATVVVSLAVSTQYTK